MRFIKTIESNKKSKRRHNLEHLSTYMTLVRQLTEIGRVYLMKVLDSRST